MQKKCFETRESSKRQNHDHLHPEEESLLSKNNFYLTRLEHSHGTFLSIAFKENIDWARAC